MRIEIGFAILFAAVSASAQMPGAFTPTSRMTSARFGHTATLLGDGKVLVAGGGVASAELYDPSSGAFRPTGSMTKPRSHHRATLLPDGKVLISDADSAEIYDPSAGTFRLAGRMTAARDGHSATLLTTGKVLIAGGGCGGASTPPPAAASAELYDPASDTFAATGNMTVARCNPRETLLADGRVLILPGDEGADYGSAEIYDPTTGTFSPIDWPNPQELIAATSNLLLNGNVLVSLAVQECDFLSSTALVYDSAALAFKAGPDMANGVCRPTATLLSDGKVLIAAGWFAGTHAQLYDPATGAFSPTGNLTTYRQDHAATLLQDGTVLITGGASPVGSPLDLGAYGFSATDTAELYHPARVFPAPGLLSLNGSSQGAVLHAGTGRVVSAGDPAAPGEPIEIYATGLMDSSVVPPLVAIGGRAAEILYFGNAPGLSGVNQINVRVPNGLHPGAAVSIQMSYLGRSSNAVTIGVQ
ncbi:MAG TPA: hypothetical protein VGF59_10150 [Bryobacteraceae bacterium]